MAVRELKIRKSLSVTQGRTKPLCEARAFIPASEAAILVEHFGNEPLFKRTAYANGFGDSGYSPSPALARMLANFVRNDACPEVLVKTLINGQRFEANTFWDILCFEFVAKVGFDALLVMCEGVRTLEKTLVYKGSVAEADLVAFEEEDARERAEHVALANAAAEKAKAIAEAA